MTGVQTCALPAPFGVVPVELDEVYPLSQHEIAMPLDIEMIDYVAEQVATYIERTSYQRVVLLEDFAVWGRKITYACGRVCRKKNIPFVSVQRKGKAERLFVQLVLEALKARLGV